MYLKVTFSVMQFDKLILSPIIDTIHLIFIHFTEA